MRQKSVFKNFQKIVKKVITISNKQFSKKVQGELRIVHWYYILAVSSKIYQEISGYLKSCLNILICYKTEVVRIILRLSCLVCGVKLCRFIVHAKLREGPCSSEQVLIKGRSSFITWNPLQRSAPLEWSLHITYPRRAGGRSENLGGSGGVCQVVIQIILQLKWLTTDST